MELLRTDVTDAPGEVGLSCDLTVTILESSTRFSQKKSQSFRGIFIALLGPPHFAAEVPSSPRGRYLETRGDNYERLQRISGGLNRVRGSCSREWAERAQPRPGATNR